MGPTPPAQPLLWPAEHVVALMPEVGSPQHARVLQYRELLGALPMDAYTHGCILHPELTTDSMIPKYATAEIRSECPGLLPFAHLFPFDRSLLLHLFLPLYVSYSPSSSYPSWSPSSASASRSTPFSLSLLMSLALPLGVSGSILTPSTPTPTCFLSTTLPGLPSHSLCFKLKCLSLSGCLTPLLPLLLSCHPIQRLRGSLCLVHRKVGHRHGGGHGRGPGRSGLWLVIQGTE